MLKQISAGKVNYLVTAMRELFDATILERGWHYYHRSHIEKITVSEREVEAIVRGTKTYRVTLDLQFITYSECSCPYDGYCKHMAAVCFQIYAFYGRPELLLQELKHHALSRSKRSAAMKARAQKNAEAAEPPALGNSPREWHKYFDLQFYGYSVTNQHAVEDFYAIALEKLSGLAAGWQAELRHFFLVHVLLFVLRKLDQFYAHNHTTYLSYYLEMGCRKVAAQAMEQLEQALEQMPRRQIALLRPSDLDETAEIVSELVFRDSPQVVSGIDVFRLLWTRLLDDPDRTPREIARLRKELFSHAEDSYPRKMRILALAHFDVMASEDEEAFRVMQQANLHEVDLYFWYLREFRRTDQWDRLHAWLRRLLPYLRQAKQEHFRTVCGYWVEVTSRQPSDEEWVQVMVSLLPRSYYYYTDYLMKSGRYKQWVDLQLSHRIMPSNLYSEELKQVEAHDPGLLLPLYHQAAERYILEKNRPAYKSAVRLLRRLRSCYGKLKQEERWNDFIRRFAAKYSRLRAFQEELRKGKLIP